LLDDRQRRGMHFVKLQCRTIYQCIQVQTGQTLDGYGRMQGCIGGYTWVYAVYQPLAFFDSVYLPHLS